MPGLDPGIHVRRQSPYRLRVDGRVKPGHDDPEQRFHPSE
jgi:hypothetical protein